MVDDAGTAARHQLLADVRELLKAVRVFKSELPARHETVATGTIGVLATIDAIGGEPVGGCHLKDLAVRCALDPSTVSRAVAALVRSGLVARTADPADGRASVLAVTEQGRQALDDFTRLADERLADALREWRPEDIAVLSALLRRFSADLMPRTERTLEVAR
ncbi:MarR family winged helix-turn-helix transcriptional regulator [Actinoplanes sp. NPDC049599]|uniref:MarR family winged helix-turn-helix transcriptional regulator n=1 Tax=Actinoplanes sp. NPDC049599 TaxID=3363903 RepID=UPI0037B8C342